MAKVLLSVQEVAEATGLDPENVRRGIDRGEIAGMKIGRKYRVPLWWVEQMRSGPRAAADSAPHG